jgi:UDP-2,3-diacylglucosamine hydrolase
VTGVLGTQVFEAGDEAAAILISDLHVPDDGGAVVDDLRSAVAAAVAQRASLFVLGDLFDTYVCRRQAGTGVWRDVAELFAAAARKGVRTQILHGNRDYLLGPEFEAASGARIVAGGLRGRLGGTDTLMLHGDELCQNDLPYQRAKRWLRHPLTRWIARGLPLGLALRVAGRARRRSRMVIAAGDQQRFLPTARAIDAAFAAGAGRLVFGHIHRFSHGPWAGGDYWVLPAFDQAPVGLLCQDGRISAVRFLDAAGRLQEVPPPPACPFAP